MAENQETSKSKRDLFAERLKSRYPDREFADDEAMYGQAGEDYDTYENELNGYRERENKITELFSRDPRSAQFFKDMADGNDPWIAVIKRIGSNGIIELINDPEKQAAYEEANKEYADRLAKAEQLEAEYNANMAESQKVCEEMEAMYGEKAVDAALALIDQIRQDAIVGKVTKEAIEMAMKVINRDADMANARSEGEVAGRNAKIEEQIRKPQGGDGMPQIGGANASVRSNNRPQSIFDIAAGAN